MQNARDSSFITGAVTDTTGDFTLTTSKIGRVRVAASSIGYNNYVSEPLLLDAANPIHFLGTLVLTENVSMLKVVEVMGNAPVFEQKIDRVVLNVGDKISTAGATVLDILERSPGIVVDRSSGSLGMFGKQGVNVMINGKMNYMPPDALINYLQGLDAGNISKIELITNPPANLDAEGNAGYINLVLKVNPEDGLQGNFSITGGYGFGEVGIASANVNYRKDKFNVFGSYSYTRNAQAQFTKVVRRIGEYSSELTIDRKPVYDNQSLRFGLDFQPNERTTLGFLVNGYLNLWDMKAINTTNINSDPDTTIVSNNHERNNWKHLQVNANLVHQFKKGAIFTSDIDFLTYRNDNPTIYAMDYIAKETIFLSELLMSKKITPFSIRVAKMDYQHPLNQKLKFTGGAKVVVSDFSNDVTIRRNDAIISLLSSKSELKEEVIAIYAELSHKINEKLQAKGGVRYEYTDSELIEEARGKIVDRKFGNFFPSLFLQYEINSDQNVNLQYSRRISRPSFSDMAPFVTFLDPNSAFGGNVALKPALAHNFLAGYQIRAVNFSLEYSHENNTIVRFQNRFDPRNNKLMIVPDNLRDQQSLSFSMGFPTRFLRWWTGKVFATLRRQKSSTIEPLGIYTLTQNNLHINASQTITLPKEFRMELTGFYQTASLVGNVRFDPRATLNVAIQKKLKSNASITFSVDDIFNSLENRGVTTIPEEEVYVKRSFDFSQRTFKATFSKTFGNSKVKANRSRNSSDEEKNRVNN